MKNIPTGQDLGLTKREYTAIMAMRGILANEEMRNKLKLLADMKIDKTTHDNYIAVYAVKQADELLKQLEP